MTTTEKGPQTQTGYDGGGGGEGIVTGFESPEERDFFVELELALMLAAEEEKKRAEIAALEKAFAASDPETRKDATSQNAGLGSAAVSGASVTTAEEFLKRRRKRIGAEGPDDPDNLVA